ncbi:MAG: SDR family oxidoreductase [Candidatus Kapaibacterium sp.]
MKIDLHERTALVCGASKGIGRAVAVELSKSGANVILVARNMKDLTYTTSLLNPAGKHSYIIADLQNPTEALNIIKSQLPCENCIDILVNNSGGPPSGKIIKSEISDFIDAMERHLHASHLITQELSKGMISKNFGRIINIISVSVKQPIENLGVSNTVRAAMAAWAKTLSIELGAFGITVNNILPGQTATDRLNYLIENIATASGESTGEVELRMKSMIPAGRFAKPEEIAYLAVFLASEYSSFINGTSIPVDGGFVKSI